MCYEEDSWCYPLAVSPLTGLVNFINSVEKTWLAVFLIFQNEVLITLKIETAVGHK